MQELAVHSSVQLLPPELSALGTLEDPRVVRNVIEELRPVIRARAARALRRQREHRVQRRDAQQEIDELTQEALLVLFAEDARVLRSWDPARGLSLSNFAGLIAERCFFNVLQSTGRRPWHDSPDNRAAAELTESDDPEAAFSVRQTIDLLRARLLRDHTPLALHFFELFFIEGRSMDDVQTSTGLTRAALYAWRSRIGRAIRAAAADAQA